MTVTPRPSFAISRRALLGGIAGTSAAAALAACGGGSGDGGNTLKVVFQQFGASRVQADFLAGVKKEFEAANAGVTVQFEPIVAGESDYYTKLQLLMRSPRTAPDVVYEDTFLINSDIEAGYLTALDDRLNAWSDWPKFLPAAKAAAKALDGKTYGVPDGTDTRALWYNKDLFEKAGLDPDWEPRTWDDVLTTARTLKAKLPGVVPLNIYTGTGVGEATTITAYQMLLYGTGENPLFDPTAQKWVIGGQGVIDTLTFYQTVFSEGLGPDIKQALSPDFGNTVNQKLIPQGKVAISLDGSYACGTWLETGPAPWPEWHDVLGVTGMPRQHGDGPDVSMSGGWTYAIPAKSQNADKAWEFIKTVTSQKNETTFDINQVQIPVRSDVAADPTYIAANPTNEFFAGLVENTQYRPAYAVYPRISTLIQQATEAVSTGRSTPAEAAADYDAGVKEAAGDAVTS
ncbi:extracellular solute-binding protein [Kineosporia succinea]|uniref:Multiple sugar transport system substrate-binding protein n=1 Tax=Kineosporia succinea TaxID=84632 RepID=A0ABT9PBJ7_9ACTN|nr:extracellular solute-binding protein [Kineosporia succinea]MDP9829560.1 multiple sugar transport system substrate-binding protein [Kineosporia succinea]